MGWFIFDFFKNQIHMKSFVILAVLHRSLYQVGRTHVRLIAPAGNLGPFEENVAEVASRLQHCGVVCAI